MNIELDNRSGEDLPEEQYLQLAAYVMEAEGVDEDAELSISLVDEEEMHALNKTYRGIDAPTDVLSFENDGGLLGDVIICPAVARQHAVDFSTDFAYEMGLMLTHGILHLKGYDHIEDAEAEVMEQRENGLLAAWNTAVEKKS